MVVYHIEYDADTILVKLLHHRLELEDTPGRISGVIAVASLRNIIVERVVSPVILRLVGLVLVNGSEVE